MRRKLNLGFMVIILLLWAICLYTLLSSMSVHEVFGELEGDIVPGAIAMTEMDGTANQIAHGTVEYILTGDAKAKAEVQTASEWLENSLAAHKEHEINIGYLEKKEAEKLEECGKKLISVANEIINLKDQGVSKEVLLKKENEELEGVLYLFVEHVMSHKAEHLQELSAAETKVHGKHYANIKYTIILGLVATLLGLLIGLLVDRLFMGFITERKQAEETLWESEKKYRDLAENIGELIYRADPETFVASYVNKAIESLYGYTPEEWLEDPSLWENSIYPDDKERVLTEFIEAQNKMENALAEYRIVRKDKTVRWVEDHLSWGKDPQNNVVSMNGVMYDITERKQAEEALRETEEKYRMLFENAAEAIYVAQDGKIKFPNPRTEELYGYSAEELTSKPFTYFIHEKDQNMVLERHKKRLRGEKPPTIYPFRIVNKAGDTKWIEIKVAPFSWEHRPATLCFLTDITERRQAEEALKEKTYDLSERVKELNCLYGISALVEQQGISLEEILEGTADLIPLSWQYPEITCARIILESQEHRTQNFKVTIWKQASDIVVHGERTGAVEVYYLEEKPEIDEGPFLKEERSLINAIAERLGKIIEHNQAAEQVELARRRLADILEAMIDGVTIVDLTGKITYINRGTTEQLGYSSEEAVGRTPAEIFLDEKELPKFLNRVKASMTGETATGEGYLAKRKDGTRFPISVNISVLRDAHGEPESIVAVHRDVTEHERAADELRQAREAAEGASQAKSEFLANMSHEIRTPMNSVIGFTDMLLDSNLDEDQVDYASTIKSSGEALLSLIDDILDFSKIEAGELGFEEIDFDPELLAYDVCDLIRPRIRSKQIEILCRISDNLPSQVKGDPGRFRQVLANLIANSTKFTDSGEIELSLDVEEETDDQIKLHTTIRDTGIGIPKDKLATIFDPFQQADGSTTRKYGGTGLGLSICKKISELMHGNIWAESPADCQLSIVNWRLEDNSEIRNRKSKIQAVSFILPGGLEKPKLKKPRNLSLSHSLRRRHLLLMITRETWIY